MEGLDATIAIETMCAFENHWSIQSSGLRLLGLLCCGEASIERIKDQGGLDRVVATMKIFCQAKEIQGLGCAFLSMLACKDHHQRLLGASGGIEAVLNAMKVSKDDASILDIGCGTLLNLAITPIAKERIVDAGGLELLFDVLRNKAFPAVRETAMGALHNIIINGPPEPFLLLFADNIDAVLGAIKDLPGHADVQVAGVVILFCLTSLAGFQDHPSQSAVINTVRIAMTRLSNEEMVQECGRWILEYFDCQEPSFLEKMLGRLIMVL